MIFSLCTIGLLSNVVKIMNGTAKLYNYVLFVFILSVIIYYLYASYQERKNTSLMTVFFPL
ncbi:hypothetical protein FO522_26815 [Bacillus nitratireducens]|nr:hypothetical protein [Bacillus nitratireducens]